MIPCAGCLLTLLIAVPPSFGTDDLAGHGIAIVVDERGAVSVRDVTGPSLELERNAHGLIVWEDGGREHWQALAPGGRWVREESRPTPPGVDALSASTRGLEGASAGSAGPMPASVPLAQLLGALVVRGDAGFLTPAFNGRTLDPRITIRRRPALGEPRFPKGTAVLVQEGRQVAAIPLPEGRQTIAWSEVRGLPPELARGLSPGVYSLRVEGGGSVAFRVEDEAVREQVLRPLDELARLRGKSTDGLHALVAVTHLLTRLDEDGKPLAYLADALDVIDRLPPGQLTPYLRRTRSDIEARLTGDARARPAPDDDPTGVPEIDLARRQIVESRWKEAAATLAKLDDRQTPRVRALAKLYRAVVHGESGLAVEEQADRLFVESLKELEALPKPQDLTDPGAADLFRAHNAFANYLLGRAQDRLYNHAYRMVTGGRLPILSALVDWNSARVHYESALELANASKLRGRAQAIQTNQARLYALLADLLRALEDPTRTERRFSAEVRAASAKARALAAGIVEERPGEPPVELAIRASARETLAQLAFRDDRASAEQCAQLAGEALRDYEDAGSLAGVESIIRLLALNRLRTGAAAAPAASRAEALRELLVAHRLSELILEQIPGDGIGLALAGFLSRRAYVNEKIVALLVADGRPAEALGYAELAKARALEALLAASGTTTQSNDDEPRPIAEILSGWPREVAAVEYLLGSEGAWGFVVTTSGAVQAFELKDRAGRPLVPQDLAARVRTFLGGIEGHATRLRSRLLAGQGFDNRWQDTLHEFAAELLPATALDELRRARTVLVVPHHVLHYFPFAALVTEVDARHKDPSEMVQPRFLIDEPFSIDYAPSLTTWDLLRQREARPIARVGAAGIVEFPGAAPLPGVEKDLANLKSAFGARVGHVYLEGEAREPAGRTLLSEPGMVLFATHGTNVADRPLSSYILLYPEAKDDGRLSAEEIFSGPCRADLVVLSACYTGLADRSPLPGDDLFGIQRALLRSGVRTVISGLWDVYDGTGPELIGGLFDNLAAGKPAPSALADSQRAFLKRLRASTDPEPWLHPYFWAVYTAAGDDRTRFGP